MSFVSKNGVVMVAECGGVVVKWGSTLGDLWVVMFVFSGGRSVVCCVIDEAGASQCASVFKWVVVSVVYCGLAWLRPNWVGCVRSVCGAVIECL